jgi:methyl-accepting chemotaxis protein
MNQLSTTSVLPKLSNLPISRKTGLIPWLSLGALTIVVGSGGIILRQGLQKQLTKKVQSQLAVTQIQYNIKIDQMGFGFRGQSDNRSIIAVAEADAKGQSLPDNLSKQVKAVLQNEIKARQIEYATLVGIDGKIIANANADRTNQSFNPNGLVSRVVNNPTQIKTSELVSWNELAQEKPPLPEGFEQQDALIRYTVTPVKDSQKSKVVGVLISGDIVNNKLPIVENSIDAFVEGGYSAIYLYNPQTNQFSLSTSLKETNQEKTYREKHDRNLQIPLSDESLLTQAVANIGEIVTGKNKIDGSEYALAAKALPNQAGEAVAVIIFGTPTNSIAGIFRNSLLVQIIVALGVLSIIVWLTRILGQAIAEPIRELQQVTQEFSEGNLKARAIVHSTDEVGLLASTFNVMADSIETNESRLQLEAKRSQLLKEIALSIGQALNLEEVLNLAVEQSRLALETDRVIYYRFDENWQGTVIAESVASEYPEALGAKIHDPCFANEYVEKYRQGRVQAVTNIYEANLTECHLQQLEPFAVKANIVAPILSGEKLDGLLIAHQCDRPRNWQTSEIDLLVQVANQISNALERANLLEQQKTAEAKERQAREHLQRRALELLMEVDPVSKGDLTIRARVQEDEIGTIADSYNATIESLRKIVNQVQTAAQLVSTTTKDKETAIQQLSTGALEQTKEITAALKRIETMAASIRVVANSAEQAEAAVKQATETVKAGDEAMNRTVDGFMAIRETVAETAKKVKRLGESSQKISKVVNLISSFADQTNLLALNASIEAAHAGEEGRGFAVVADEVRSLARQSAEATAEIEALVAEIQAETNEVVAAMESGTEQVVTGTKLVDATRSSLNQIANVSNKIEALVNSIAQAAIEQSQDSETVSQTIAQIAAIADQTSSEAMQVSESFKELLAVAQELQSSVGKFKVS